MLHSLNEMLQSLNEMLQSLNEMLQFKYFPFNSDIYSTQYIIMRDTYLLPHIYL